MNDIEKELHEKFIDQTIIVFAVLGVTAYIFAQMRSITIGWVLRDFFQTIIVTLVVVCAFYRKKLSSGQKASFLIITMLTVAFLGWYTLGMFAGGVFYFPLAIVIMSLFFSKKVTICSWIIFILITVIIAYGHASGIIKSPSDVNLLLKNYFNWINYIYAMCLTLSISALAIYSFRRVTMQLLHRIGKQNEALEQTNQNLANALDEIKTLKGLMPICSSCKKIRDDKGFWNQIETYVEKHSDATFSHSMCPECSDKFYGKEEWYIKRKKKKEME